MNQLWLSCAALVLVGCASFGKFAGTGDKTVTVASDVDENLKLGQEALASKNFADAQKYFEYVKTKYPFLEAAKTAELLLADTDFDRETFSSAREKYQSFVKLHPTHPKKVYAAFRAALTHYRDIPSDFFVLPPSAEKEQVEVRSALAAINSFLNEHAKSEFTDEANRIRDDVRRRLAKHEFTIAEFYRSREKWSAVVNRLTQIEKYYAGVGWDEQVAFGLYESYLKLNRPDDAKNALAKYASQNPEKPAAKRAQQLLGVKSQ
jgi:outer membrane protein assembly factor BamD